MRNHFFFLVVIVNAGLTIAFLPLPGSPVRNGITIQQQKKGFLSNKLRLNHLSLYFSPIKNINADRISSSGIIVQKVNLDNSVIPHTNTIAPWLFIIALITMLRYPLQIDFSKRSSETGQPVHSFLLRKILTDTGILLRTILIRVASLSRKINSHILGKKPIVNCINDWNVCTLIDKKKFSKHHMRYVFSHLISSESTPQKVCKLSVAQLD